MKVPLTGQQLTGRIMTDMTGVADAEKALAALRRYKALDLAWYFGLADPPAQPCGHPRDARRRTGTTLQGMVCTGCAS